MNRRTFLQTILATLVAGGSTPSLLARTAAAARAEGKALLVVQLSGGNDALNTLVPFRQALYRRLRPTIGLKTTDLLPLSDRLALHPAMRPLVPLFEDGRLGLVQGIGYPHPNRSHFVSMAVWHTADPERRALTGWLGRVLDQDKDPFCAVNFGVLTPLALRGKERVAPSLASLDRFRLDLPPGYAAVLEAVLKAPYRGLEAAVQQRIAELKAATARVARIPRKKVKGLEGSRFGLALADVLAMLDAPDPPKVFYTALGGFDTHANEPPRQAALLAELAGGLAAFYRELKGMGRERDVVVFAFSEFGRRAAENASAGTDHGKAGLALVLGGGVKGGLYGTEPDLEALDDGDLPLEIDFRRAYADLLGFLDADPAEVLGRPFTPLGLVSPA